jgi:hypothetical protein
MRIVGCVALFNVPAFWCVRRRDAPYVWILGRRILWSSVQAGNQFRHPFRPHHAPGFARNPNRAACVKLSELCFRRSRSIATRSSPPPTRTVISGAALADSFPPFRPCFPGPSPPLVRIRSTWRNCFNRPISVSDAPFHQKPGETSP